MFATPTELESFTELRRFLVDNCMCGGEINRFHLTALTPGGAPYNRSRPFSQALVNRLIALLEKEAR